MFKVEGAVVKMKNHPAYGGTAVKNERLFNAALASASTSRPISPYRGKKGPLTFYQRSSVITSMSARPLNGWSSTCDARCDAIFVFAFGLYRRFFLGSIV
jgi:hypothetical protein